MAISSSLLPDLLSAICLYISALPPQTQGNGPLFSAFQKGRELGDDVVVVCGMAPIILIYLPRHLEMVTCQKNIIHNISERSHKHASNKKIWPCFIESRKCFSCKGKLCKIKGESFANLPEVNKVNILKKESLETKSKWCKTLYISCICILRDYP